jgi:diguanylate cyclase (GGDEF)-like protein
MAALAATRCLDPDACHEAVARGGMDLLGGCCALVFGLDGAAEDLECSAGVAAAPEDQAVLDAARRTLGVLDASLVRALTEDGPARIEPGRVLVPAETDGDAEGPDELQGEPLPGEALLVMLEGTAGPAALLLVLCDGNPARGWQEKARSYADALAPAFDNLRDVSMLRELVQRDDTTDCYNRRSLDECLDDEVERARRFGARFAVIFLDMDNLKEVNTLHGHAAGSKVLRDAAVRIARCIRSVDRLYRYGGDEFVVFLPGTSVEGARDVAERIRGALAREPFEAPTGALVSLTASTGVAVWPDHAADGRDVLMAADEAMRRVKASGKDGVEAAGADPRAAGPK